MEEKKVRLTSFFRVLLVICVAVFTLLILRNVTGKRWLVIIDIICLVFLLFDYYYLINRISSLKEALERKEDALDANIQYIQNTDKQHSQKVSELQREIEELRFWKQTALSINPDLENMISPKKQAENIDAKILDALQLDDSPKNFGKIRNLLRDYESLPSIVKAEITADIYELRQKYDDMTAI